MLAPPDKSVEVEPQAHAVASQRRHISNCPPSQLGPKLKRKRKSRGDTDATELSEICHFNQSASQRGAHRKHLKSFCISRRSGSMRFVTSPASCRWKA